MAASDVKAAGAVLVLHPAEPRGVRKGPWQSEDGDVVQDTDNDIAISHTNDSGQAGAGEGLYGRNVNQELERALEPVLRHGSRPNYNIVTSTSGMFDYGAYVTSFVTESHEVDEIGGAEVVVKTVRFGNVINTFTIYGVERTVPVTLYEYAGRRGSRDYDPDQYMEFWEDDPFDDDFIGFTTSSDDVQFRKWESSSNSYWIWGTIGLVRSELQYLPPVVSSSTPVTLYRGQSKTVTINGDYFLADDELTPLASGLSISNKTRVSPYVWTATVTASVSANSGIHDLLVARATSGLSETATNLISVPVALSVGISGPGFIPVKAGYVWEAMPSSGVAPYSYTWSVYYPSTGVSEVYSGSKTFSMVASPGVVVRLTATVTSSTGESASASLWVNEQ